jgi:hypothetical protein
MHTCGGTFVSQTFVFLWSRNVTWQKTFTDLFHKTGISVKFIDIHLWSCPSYRTVCAWLFCVADYVL